jgi:hypothetical protein
MSLWLETNDVEEVYEKCLEGDYVVCSKCDGTGDSDSYPGNICHKCWGEGKLDWIENIMGKENPFNESSSTSSVSSSINTTTLPTSKRVKNYINETRRRNYEHNNSIRSRALQRFSKVFDKSKRRM